MQSFYEWAYVVERRFSTSQHVDTVASRPKREQSAAASAATP